MKITRLGHAAVLLEGSKTILIDPFLKDNPLASTKAEGLPPIDVIVVTHDHFDHLGDAINIAKQHGSELVCVHEISTMPEITDSGIKVTGMNIGGTYGIDEVNISLTPAVHSVGTGDAAGAVVVMDGTKVYHAGDTALFGDMALIGEVFGPLDVALLPIGGHFTMDVKAAAKAAALVNARVTVPIHYDTWPPIAADPSELKEAYSGEVIILDPGQSHEIGQ